MGWKDVPPPSILPLSLDTITTTTTTYNEIVQNSKSEPKYSHSCVPLKWQYISTPICPTPTLWIAEQCSQIIPLTVYLKW
jgi:hypothetical protein